MNLSDNWLCTYLNVWNWHDCIELITIVICCYYLVAWLAREKTKKLLIFFYCYGACFLISYFINLPTIHAMLILGTPIVAVIAILMHQESLQKNYITPYKIIPAKTTHDWLDELMQSCLIAINLKKPFICVIEYKDDLSSLLSSACTLNTQVHKSLMVTLLQSNLFEENSIVWINVNGNLTGINCSWIHELCSIEQCQQERNWNIACTISLKTDAIYFKINPDQNSFDLAVRGNIVTNLTSNNCLKILRQHLTKSHNNNEKSLGNIRKDAHEEHRA
jgi:hypothetical protein